MSSDWGERVRIRVFGESHGEAVGAVLEGLPAHEAVDLGELARFLERRAPGRSALTSRRREADRPELLGGLCEGETTGEPLTIRIQNTDVRPADYEALRDVPRPGHADYPALVRFGAEAVRGGGRFSGRMTAPLCAAGGICLQLLRRRGITVTAHLRMVGEIEDEPFDPMGLAPGTAAALAARELPTLSAEAGARMKAAILAAAADGDSIGGTVECMIEGLPVGLGGALFDGLDGRLAAALFAIPAVKGVEFGAGFGASRLRGSENNDPYRIRNGAVTAETNRAGGILGGMSTGLPVLVRAAFKPTPSIARPQRSVRLSTLEETELRVTGRHDPCVAVRAVPVVEAMAALTVLDALLSAERALPQTIEDLRGEIDRLDASIAPQLASRMRLSDEIGRIKKERALPVRDEAREEALLRRVRALAEADGADSIERVYRAVLAESRARQDGEDEA